MSAAGKSGQIILKYFWHGEELNNQGTKERSRLALVPSLLGCSKSSGAGSGLAPAKRRGVTRNDFTLAAPGIF
jgi:hypothetical protein